MLKLFNNNKNQPTTENVKCVIVAGHPGSGKTSVGRIIAGKTNFAFLDKDTITGDMVELVNLIHRQSNNDNFGYAGDRESPFYSEWEFSQNWENATSKNRLQTISTLTNNIALEVAEENLKLNNSVLLCAPFVGFLLSGRLKQWRSKFSGVKFYLIWVNLDIDYQKRFLTDRNAIRDRVKLNKWEEYSRSLFPFAIEPELCQTIGFQEIEIEIFNNDPHNEISRNDEIEKIIKWIRK